MRPTTDYPYLVTEVGGAGGALGNALTKTSRTSPPVGGGGITMPPIDRDASKERARGRVKVPKHPALLVVDEIGYLPITRTDAMLSFR